jgi:aryl-alcohol dehydrogenase-like predicted oxidoreductase
VASPIPYTLLGATGLRVSTLCLGTMTFGQEWGWGADKQTSRAMFDRFVASGGNFIDTANNYTGGTSETWLGEFVARSREQFVVGTKYSLSTNPSLTPVEEVMRALDDVVRAGKVLYIGISDTPAWVISYANALAELRGWSAFAGVQAEYILARRDAEHDLLPMARALVLSLLAWSPLANGLLTGKYNGTSAGPARMAPESSSRNRPTERGLAIAGAVLEAAREIGCTPSATRARLAPPKPPGHPNPRLPHSRPARGQRPVPRCRDPRRAVRTSRRGDSHRPRLPARLPQRRLHRQDAPREHGGRWRPGSSQESPSALSAGPMRIAAMRSKLLAHAPLLTAIAVTAAMAAPAPAVAKATGARPPIPPPRAHARPSASIAVVPGAARIRGERRETGISRPL